MLRVIFHMIIFGVYSCAVTYGIINFDIPSKSIQRFKYLTEWNEIIQLLYFGLAVLNDCFGSNSGVSLKKGGHRSGLEQVRDAVFFSVVFPMGIFVVVVFWTLYLIDRELVFPAALDAFYPSWLNHTQHTTVALYLLLELKLVFHKRPRRTTGFTILFLFAAAYLILVAWLAFYANDWVYPVLKILTMPQRILFFASLLFALFPFYFLGEWLSERFWISEREVIVKKTL